MIDILIDNSYFWSYGDNDSLLAEATLDLAVNTVGSLTLKIYPGHRFYGSMERMKTIATVRRNGVIIFIGRLYKESLDFYRCKTLEFEGTLGYLNDSVHEPYTYTGSPAGLLQKLVLHHNEFENNTNKAVSMGTLSVATDETLTVESQDYVNTWKEIQDKVLSPYGGYLYVSEYGTNLGNPRIEWVDDISTVSASPIKYAVNLTNLKADGQGDSLITRLIPFGAEVETSDLDAKGNPIKARVTIESVNNGKKYIEDSDSISKYGPICEVVTFDDCDTPSKLLGKARIYLVTKTHMLDTIELTAADLGGTDFTFGTKVSIVTDPHGINETSYILGYKMDLCNIGNSVVTVGLERESYLKNTTDNITNRIDEVIHITGDMVTEIVKDEVEGIGDDVSEIVIKETERYVNTQIENSEQKTSNLLKEYVKETNLAEYKEQVSTDFTQTAEQFEMRFDRVEQTISTVDENATTKIDEISKYIRFVDGNIILGEEGNSLTTKIANGRISFLYHDTLEVAYISDDKLYITQAEILDSIILGSFAFTPRENGSLAFGKVT